MEHFLFSKRMNYKNIMFLPTKATRTTKSAKRI